MRDFAAGRKTRFGRSLFDGKRFVFDEKFTVVSVQLGKEEIFDNANLFAEELFCERFEGWRRFVCFRGGVVVTVMMLGP